MPFELNRVVTQKIPPSGIRVYFDIAAQDKSIISLSVGEPDFVTPELFRAAAKKSMDDGITGYTSNQGIPEVRQAIVDFLQAHYELQYDPNKEVMVTVGVSEGFDNALRAILNPGDEVIIPKPCFVSYEPMTLLAGGTPVPVNSTFENRFKIRPEQIEEKITGKTKALVINYPNNPSGATFTREELQRIAAICVENNLIVLADEVYSEITYGNKPASIASLPGMKERTILLSGFSKYFAMTGMRMGYICAPNEILSPILKIHQYAIMSAPTASQYASVAALRHGYPEVERMVKSYQERRDLIVKGLQEAGLECNIPEGAFYVFPRVRKLGVDGEQFAQGLLKHKVALVPGFPFGDAYRDHIRICYAAAKDKIIEALRRIKTFTGELKKKI
jgi:aminotransferase